MFIFVVHEFALAISNKRQIMINFMELWNLEFFIKTFFPVNFDWNIKDSPSFILLYFYNFKFHIYITFIINIIISSVFRKKKKITQSCKFKRWLWNDNFIWIKGIMQLKFYFFNVIRNVTIYKFDENCPRMAIRFIIIQEIM